jgi:hypothetical protein
MPLARPKLDTPKAPTPNRPAVRRKSRRSMLPSRRKPKGGLLLSVMRFLTRARWNFAYCLAFAER